MSDPRAKGTINADIDRELDAAMRAWLDEHRHGPRTVDEAVGVAMTLMRRAAVILMEQSGAVLSDRRAHQVTTSNFMLDLAFASHYEECEECRELTQRPVAPIAKETQ